MFTVALIGPDGAGKTTIGQSLQHLLPMPIEYVYMGANSDASNHLLPTTRAVWWGKKLLGLRTDAGGPLDPSEVARRARRGKLRRAIASLKSSASLVNRVFEEWYRQTLAWYYCKRRRIVLFDRHYFSDYYAYDIACRPRSFGRRLHGFLLNNVYPKPDLVIYLDAPAEVLHARKGEGSIELLEQRRHDYLRMRDLVRRFEIVDASQAKDDVLREVKERICQFCAEWTSRESATNGR